MDAERYRTKEEIKMWKGRDPIKRHKKYLLENKIATEKEILTIEEGAKKEIAKAIEFATASPYPDKAQAQEDVYAKVE